MNNDEDLLPSNIDFEVLRCLDQLLKTFLYTHRIEVRTIAIRKFFIIRINAELVSW